MTLSSSFYILNQVMTWVTTCCCWDIKICDDFSLNYNSTSESNLFPCGLNLCTGTESSGLGAGLSEALDAGLN